MNDFPPGEDTAFLAVESVVVALLQKALWPYLWVNTVTLPSLLSHLKMRRPIPDPWAVLEDTSQHPWDNVDGYAFPSLTFDPLRDQLECSLHQGSE